MAISKAQKAAYNDEIKNIKTEIDTLQKNIRETASKRKEMPNLEGYFNIETVYYLVKDIEYNIQINNLSVQMLNIKNNKSLDNAKSSLSKILQFMKETVGDEVDRDSLKENEEYLSRIGHFNARQILDLANKIDETFRSLRDSMGEDSKWKWLFVEFQAKLAVINRNLLNFSDMQKYRDPRQDFFHDRREHLHLVKDSLAEAAKQYRTKYELSAKSREDLKKSIDLLEALRKVHMVMGESSDADKLKTTIDAARQNLDAGDKKDDKDGKKKK